MRQYKTKSNKAVRAKSVLFLCSDNVLSESACKRIIATAGEYLKNIFDKIVILEDGIKPVVYRK